VGEENNVPTHRVKFEPVNIEIDVDQNENVLQAAFRQGYMLAHGCKAGQCSACKAYLLEGDTDLGKYSTFALSDMEREEGYTLLCKTHVYSDTTIELLHFDEDTLRCAVPIRTVATRVADIEALTHDIRRLRLDLVTPGDLTFAAGQYVDIHIPGGEETRSFSMANTPAQRNYLEFIIKLYPGGLFSGMLESGLRPGDPLDVTGPYGTCTLRDKSERDLILMGGGAGMAPLWSLINALAESGSQRKVTFYYGARAPRDLFYLDELTAIGKRLPNFKGMLALSEVEPGQAWSGEVGMITDVADRSEPDLTEHEAYICGPPPMVDAAMALLERRGVPPERIYFDKFTTTASPDMALAQRR
jgi:propane monooxygenase reductase subunit